MAESPIAGYICDYPNPSGEKKIAETSHGPKAKMGLSFPFQ